MNKAIVASVICASFAWSGGALASGSEMPPVGASWNWKCTGDGAGERTYKVVKNDGKTYRIEATDGSYVEGPVWGRVMGFNTLNEIVGGTGKFAAEVDSGNLHEAVVLEVGRSYSGYIAQDTPRGRFSHRHDVSVKERAEKELPFGKTEAVLVVDKYGNNFWSATRTIWYSPELKSAISADFESSNGGKSNCHLLTKPE